MSLRKAAQQALEALEQCGFDDTRRNYQFEGKACDDLRAALSEEAMQRLTEVQQEMEPVANPTHIYDFAGWLTTRPGTLVTGSKHEAGPMAEAIGEYLRTFPDRFAVPPVPQQDEPVAWMVYMPDGKSVCVTDNPADFTDQHRALPLYTFPPKPEWVRLTDEELKLLCNESYIMYGDYAAEFVRAIEAKLKEKNT